MFGLVNEGVCHKYVVGSPSAFCCECSLEWMRDVSIIHERLFSILVNNLPKQLVMEIGL